MENTMLIYAAFFVGALVCSLLTNKILLKFANNLGVRDLDEINMIRWSSQTKPSLGGLGFYIVFLLAFVAAALLPDSGMADVQWQLGGLFLACTAGFFVGLADDAYNTNPLMKFIGQFTCANILIVSGISIELTNIDSLNYCISILWVVGMMNSLNMLDNMDGITAGVSVTVLLGGLMVLATIGTVNPLAYIMLAMLGGLLGFLHFNWNPSKMYMGDTGSMFLGVLLSAIGILLFWNVKQPTGEFLQIQQFIMPMLIFAVPLIDTLTVVIRRLARGQSPFVGGRDHTTHHLALLGFKDGWVAAIFCGTSMLAVLGGYYTWTLSSSWSFGYSLIAIAAFAALFLAVQLYYSVAGKRSAARKRRLRTVHNRRKELRQRRA